MMARSTDTRQCSTRREFAPSASDRVLYRVLFDPDVDVDDWSSADGSARVAFHRSDDHWSWWIRDRYGRTDMAEDVLAELDGSAAPRLRVVR